MAEGIAGKVGRIISGGLHALVDAVEGAAPEMIMEQAIREIDGAIDEIRAELGKVVAGKHLANTRLMDENKRHEELSEQVEVAVRESRDDLAETAVGRLLDIESQIPILEASISDAADKEAELEGFIKALQAKKREMRDDLKGFRQSRSESGQGEAGMGTVTSASSVDSRVEKATAVFDRAVERSASIPGRLDRGIEDASKLSELEELSRKNRISERLTEVKKRLS